MFAVAAGLLLILMIVALFLPWSFVGGSSQDLSDYAAPQPSIIAWLLLALGLAMSLVTVVGLFFGGRRSGRALTAGPLLYLIGAAVWYAASILPDAVAGGCNSNGGPLCNTPATSPTLTENAVGPGFVLGVVASLLLLGFSVVGPRVLRLGHDG